MQALSAHTHTHAKTQIDDPVAYSTLCKHLARMKQNSNWEKWERGEVGFNQCLMDNVFQVPGGQKLRVRPQTSPLCNSW
jgi:hypothetical protein